MISVYLADGHGNVRMLADMDGNITDTYDYDAFGNLTNRTGETENNYLCCGEQYDKTTGYYYLRARYMNPVTGTFTSMDGYAGSIFDPVTLHKYLYANANPIMNIDPSGYFTLGDLNVTQTIKGILSKAQTINYQKVLARLAINAAGGAACGGIDTMLGGGNLNEILTSMKNGAIAGAVLSIFVQFKVIYNIIKIVIPVSLIGSVSESIQEGNIKQACFRAISFIALTFSLYGRNTAKYKTSNDWFDSKGNRQYPPNNGAVPGTSVEVVIQPNETLVRFGEPTPNSNFVTQSGFTPDQLSLPPWTDPNTRIEYKVKLPIQGAIKSVIAAWGDSEGGGIQFELPMPIVELIKLGYLE